MRLGCRSDGSWQGCLGGEVEMRAASDGYACCFDI